MNPEPLNHEPLNGYNNRAWLPLYVSYLHTGRNDARQKKTGAIAAAKTRLFAGNADAVSVYARTACMKIYGACHATQ